MAAGDMDAVIALLHPDVTLVGDANGKTRTAIHTINGPEKVARFLFGLARRYGPGWLESSRLALTSPQVRGVSLGSVPDMCRIGAGPRLRAGVRGRW